MPAFVAFAAGASAQCELDKLVASDAAFADQVGGSISVSGATVVVGGAFTDGAGADSGSAYVFERQGSVWVQSAELTAGDAAAADELGWSVSLSGDTVLVGAPKDDDAGSSSGSAYVFDRQGAAWVEVAKLTASDAVASDLFGYSVSLEGDRAVVGAVGGEGAKGAAYVFERQGAVWVETAKLTASDGVIFDNFGQAVSLSGDRALVAAPSADDTGLTDNGAVYVFDLQGPAWVETDRLTAFDAESTDYLGISVSLSGDVAFVGAPFDGVVGINSGSAYVFELQGAAWGPTAKLFPADAEAGDFFGLTVSVVGDTALIGMPVDDGNTGSVRVYESSGGAWVPTTKLVASDGEQIDQFGLAVSSDGSTAAIAAPTDSAGVFFSGSAYAFTLTGPCIDGPTPGSIATINTIDVSQATPGGLVGVGFGLGEGSTPVGAICPGLMVNLANPTVIGSALADGTGTASFGGFVPASLSGTTVFLQGVDLAACEVTNLISHTFL